MKLPTKISEELFDLISSLRKSQPQTDEILRDILVNGRSVSQIVKEQQIAVSQLHTMKQRFFTKCAKILDDMSAELRIVVVPKESLEQYEVEQKKVLKSWSESYLVSMGSNGTHSVASFAESSGVADQ